MGLWQVSLPITKIRKEKQINICRESYPTFANNHQRFFGCGEQSEGFPDVLG